MPIAELNRCLGCTQQQIEGHLANPKRRAKTKRLKASKERPPSVKDWSSA